MLQFGQRDVRSVEGGGRSESGLQRDRACHGRFRLLPGGRSWIERVLVRRRGVARQAAQRESAEQHPSHVWTPQLRN